MANVAPAFLHATAHRIPGSVPETGLPGAD